MGPFTEIILKVAIQLFVGFQENIRAAPHWAAPKDHEPYILISASNAPCTNPPTQLNYQLKDLLEAWAGVGSLACEPKLTLESKWVNWQSAPLIEALKKAIRLNLGFTPDNLVISSAGSQTMGTCIANLSQILWSLKENKEKTPLFNCYKINYILNPPFSWPRTWAEDWDTGNYLVVSVWVFAPIDGQWGLWLDFDAKEVCLKLPTFRAPGSRSSQTCGKSPLCHIQATWSADRGIRGRGQLLREGGWRREVWTRTQRNRSV